MLQTADDVRAELANRINMSGVSVERKGDSLEITYRQESGKALELTVECFALKGADLHHALRNCVNVSARDITQARQYERLV